MRTACLLLALSPVLLAGEPEVLDPRDIRNGHEIPSEGYCDQPYVVKTRDGAWLCVMTTGHGKEGERGQHIVSTRSTDRGKSWSPLIDIEPASGPTASWAVPLIVPSGRVYVFYTYNAKNLTEVKSDGGPIKRVDTLGEYTFKFSDDGGKTWSVERFFVPVREMDIDRRNPYDGNVRFFWGVGRPAIVNGGIYLPIAKVGHFGAGFIAESQGCFLYSDNLLTEADPSKLHWTTLPDGDHGLRSPQGPIAEEPTVVGLSDGSLFSTYRTVAGHPCHAYSRDGGKTWTAPAFMTYGAGRPLVNHPRAANFVWKLRDGRFLYWFHNHDGKSYEGRNPAWLLGGIEQDSPEGKVIRWSRPQVVLYAADRNLRMSYPDLIEEDDGRLYLTETQKTVARVHEVDPAVLEVLWWDLTE